MAYVRVREDIGDDSRRDYRDRYFIDQSETQFHAMTQNIFVDFVAAVPVLVHPIHPEDVVVHQLIRLCVAVTPDLVQTPGQTTKSHFLFVLSILSKKFIDLINITQKKILIFQNSLNERKKIKITLKNH